MITIFILFLIYLQNVTLLQEHNISKTLSNWINSTHAIQPQSYLEVDGVTPSWGPVSPSVASGLKPKSGCGQQDQ